PELTTDAAGQPAEERRTEPFGAAIDAFVGGAVHPVDYRDNPINALNKFTDADTGWSDHGARWMAPETGRWLTPDPPVSAPEPAFMSKPWALHPYQYVQQNPIIYWDPDGRQPALLPGDDLHTVHSMTFSDEAITRMRDFFVTNYGHPDPPGGQSGNTDPRF